PDNHHRQHCRREKRDAQKTVEGRVSFQPDGQGKTGDDFGQQRPEQVSQVVAERLVKLWIRQGVTVVKRADKVAFHPLVRIEGVDQCLRGRNQYEDEKQYEAGNEKQDLAAASHGASEGKAPKPKLQAPERSQAQSSNGCFRSSSWSLVFGASLVFGVWCLVFVTVLFAPGSLSPSSSISLRVPGPVCRSESFRPSRKTPRPAP